MRVSRGWGAWDQSLALPLWPLGFWLCKGGVGEGLPLPSETPPSWFLFPFPGSEIRKRGGGGGGRPGPGGAGGGEPGRGWNDQGTGPVRKEPSQSPSAPLPALSHGVQEQRGGRGGLVGSPARPRGQREGPRPARGAAGPPARPSPPRPSPPLPRPRAGNVLFPPLPPRGQRAGRAGRRPPFPPPHLLSPPRCEPEPPPPPLPPLTHAAPGLARRRVWDRVRGWGCRAESGPAGAPWWPCPARAGAPGGHLALVTPAARAQSSWGRRSGGQRGRRRANAVRQAPLGRLGAKGPLPRRRPRPPPSVHKPLLSVSLDSSVQIVNYPILLGVGCAPLPFLAGCWTPVAAWALPCTIPPPWPGGPSPSIKGAGLGARCSPSLHPTPCPFAQLPRYPPKSGGRG